MFLLEHLASGYVALHTGDCRASPDVREAVRAELRRLLPHRTLVTLLAVSTRTPRAAGRPQTHAAATAPAAPAITPIPPGASNQQRKRRLGDCRDAESHPAGVASQDVSMNGGEASKEDLNGHAAGDASISGLATAATPLTVAAAPAPSCPSPAPLPDIRFSDAAPALALEHAIFGHDLLAGVSRRNRRRCRRWRPWRRPRKRASRRCCLWLGPIRWAEEGLACGVGEEGTGLRGGLGWGGLFICGGEISESTQGERLDLARGRLLTRRAGEGRGYVWTICPFPL
jgi:hypothetical protein